jgi:outer membrane protein OmpA-like peptidoglycan-associated protein
MMNEKTGFLLAATLILSACAPLPAKNAQGQGAISINQTERGVAVTIADGILFESGKHKLREDTLPIIERLAQLIGQTDKPIAVEGHTDNVGDKAYNVKLSQRRAETVARALVAHGVPARRLHTEGYGVSRPVADNSSPAGRQYNRRVEVYILGERRENLNTHGIGMDGYFDDTFSQRVQDLSDEFRRLPGIGWFF